MNKMKIFNLVYKFKKSKTEKSCAVDMSKNGIYLNKKSFIKSLRKYVNPLQRSYLKCTRGSCLLAGEIRNKWHNLSTGEITN